MECVSAVACLAPGSAGASIPVHSGSVVAVTPESARAQRFAEMLQAEPQRENVYVAAPDVASGGGNPLVSFMSQFQAFELPSGSHASVDKYEQGGMGAEVDSAFHLASSNQDLLQAQAGLIRTALMMEVMSTAKQGVTTLFQQQG